MHIGHLQNCSLYSAVTEAKASEQVKPKERKTKNQSMLNRNSESKRMKMGLSEPEVACKRHQNHKQLQGVCPVCLRERLSQLVAASVVEKKTSMVPSHSCNSSLSQSSSPASSSGNTSPGRRRRRHNRNVSEIMGSISFMLSVGSSNGLKKSRSIAFVPKDLVGELNNGKKKKGFWSKLLHRERKKDIFIHSRTVGVRETLS